MVSTQHDCCLSRVQILGEPNLRFLVIEPNLSVSGDYCCCDPPMGSEPTEDSESDTNNDTITTITPTNDESGYDADSSESDDDESDPNSWSNHPVFNAGIYSNFSTTLYIS